MARKKAFKANLIKAPDLEALRRSVESEINRLASQLGSDDYIGNVNANTFRLTDLGNPASEGDATNLKTVRKLISEALASLYAELHRPNLIKATGFNDAEFEIIPGGFVIKGVDMTKMLNFDATIFDNSTEFTVIAGGIGTTEIADDAITTPKLIAGAVTTGKLTTNEINVGYGGLGMPVLFRIYDNTNTPIGWIGDDSGGGGYVGAWFKRVMIGGDGTPANAGFFADAYGNVVAQNMLVFDATGNVGWLGNDGSGHYGGWFKEFYAGGSGASTAPLYADSSGNVYLNDGSISITDATTTVTLNTTYPLRVTNATYDARFTASSLYMSKYGYWPTTGEWVQVGPGLIEVRGGGALSFSGITLDAVSAAGGGNIYIKNTFGTDLIHLDGDQAMLAMAGGSTSNTPVIAGMEALMSYNNNPYWYDSGAASWYKLPYDSLVMHLAGTETVTGTKTFTAALTASSGILASNQGVQCGAVNPYDGTNYYYGQTNTSRKVITDLRDNAGVHEYKYQTVDIRGGVETYRSAESGWTVLS